MNDLSYFVIMSDGQKYGPATIGVLSQWAAEGRLSPNSLLEVEGGLGQVRAGNVPGILWPEGGTVAYPRMGHEFDPVDPQEGWLSKQFGATSIFMIVIASLCCPLPLLILSIAALITSKNPTSKQRALIGLIASLGSMALSAVLVSLG